MTLRSRSLLTVYCGVLVCTWMAAQSQSSTHGFKVKTIGPAKEPPSAQQMVVPYWTLEPGWDTELEVRNNMAQQKLTIIPVLRTPEGQEVPLSAVTLAPDQSVSVDLRDAVSQSHPELVGHLGSYGSIVFRFNGFATANMFAAAMVKRDGRPIDFHFDGREANSDYNSAGIAGIWWLPR